MNEVENATNRGSNPRPRASFVLGLAIVFLAAAGVMTETWLCWPDVLIDTGREMYVPWRLTQGDVLYRDVMVINGPLSTYVNAVWFRLVGTSVHHLLVLNGIILAAVLTMLYAGAYRIGGAIGATLGGLAAVGLFVFGEVIANDCSSFMMPYCHEMTHGIFLLLVMMACLWRYDIAGRHGGEGGSSLQGRRQTAWLCAASLCLGLVFLTKVEAFLAGVATLAVFVWLMWWYERVALRTVVLRIAAMLIAIALPALIAWALLSRAMPVREAMHGVLGSFAYVTNEQLRELPFYRIWMGTSDILGRPDPSESIKVVAGWTAWYAWLGGGAWAMGWGIAGVDAGVTRRTPKRWLAIVAGAAALLAAGVLIVVGKNLGPPAYLWSGAAGITKAHFPGWLDAGRPMPVLMVVSILAATLGIRRTYRQQKISPSVALDLFMRREIFVLTCAVLGLALMLKMILFARSWHYGFALGLPAGVFAFAVAGGSVPRIMSDFIPHIGGGRRGAWVMRLTVAASLAVTIFIQHRAGVCVVVGDKSHWVGTGADRFRTNGRGAVIAKVIEGLNANAPSDKTLAAIPEGAFLNYLTRRANPARYTFLVPSDMIMFGEDNISATYRQHPPDIIALIDRNTFEYGAQYFGVDYGQKLRAWIGENYTPIGQVGGHPFTPGQPFGVTILQRQSRPAMPATTP